MKLFKPSPRYLTRLRVVITLWATGFLTLGILIAWLVSLDIETTSQATRIVQAVMIADLLWYLPALKMVQSSYRARIYQFDDDEITIKSGWWTESVRLLSACQAEKIIETVVVTEVVMREGTLGVIEKIVEVVVTPTPIPPSDVPPTPVPQLADTVVIGMQQEPDSLHPLFGSMTANSVIRAWRCGWLKTCVGRLMARCSSVV